MSTVVSIDTARQERMADDKPSLDQGYCKIVNAVVEGMASQPFTAIQQRVLWAVIRYTYGWNKAKDRIAASQLAEFTGLRRQQCSTALNQLIQAGVIIREGGSRSAIKINTKPDEWSFEKKATKALINERVNSNHDLCSVNSNHGHSVNSNHGHTKDKRQSYRNTTYSSSSPSDDQHPIQKPKSSRKKPCPYEAIRDLYHDTLPDNPECVVLNDKRKSHIRQRWNSKIKNTECSDLTFWRRYFEFVAKSKFLTGRAVPAEGRKVFIASLEWLVNAENFAKVIECKYHDDDELEAEA